MTRYIDAEELTKSIVAMSLDEAIIKGIDNVNNAKYKWILTIIAKQPIIEAAPIRRGTWSEEYDPNDDLFFRRKFRCSACGGWNTYGFTKYCPECGARMDKDD
jgi:hypothetical protein